MVEHRLQQVTEHYLLPSPLEAAVFPEDICVNIANTRIACCQTQCHCFQVEIKRLNGSIAAARSQLNKAEEHLAACNRFQEFLDSITPAEHFEAARAEQERKRAAAEAGWLEECEAVRQAKVAAAKAKQQAELDYDNARTQQVRVLSGIVLADGLPTSQM